MKQVKMTDIIKEWDRLAFERFNDLKEGRDVSFTKVLKPNMIKRIRKYELNYILEVGCGVGMLTKEISKHAGKVVAIDVSTKSIEIARQNCWRENIEYKGISIEKFESTRKFNVVYSNMSLISMPDLNKPLTKINRLLTNNGKFIFSVIHPCFWPVYWDYGNSKFNYLSEQMMLTDFRIKAKLYKGLKSRHFHRPFEMYINSLIKFGFRITNIKELKNDHDPSSIWYPRFIIIECEKGKI